MNKLSTNEDPRIQRSKKSFERALLNLLKEVEFEKITVSAIAEEAQLNRATFYLHYEDKEDLLESYLTRALDEFKENAVIEHQEFSFDNSKPHPLYIRIFEHLQENYHFFKVMLNYNANTPIMYSVIDIIKSFAKKNDEIMIQNGVTFEVEMELARIYFTHAFLGSIIWWLQNEMPYSPHHMAKQLTTMSTVGPFKQNPFFTYDQEKSAH